MFRALSHVFILLLSILCLSACGFHLRGISPMPSWLNHLAVISKNNDKQFVSMIESRLEGTSVQVDSDDLAQVPYWLKIQAIQLQQQIISVAATTNPRQYDLTLTISFVLQTRTGEILEGPSNISVSRQLTLNNNRILGSKDEESILIGEMKQDAVTQIIYRLRHASAPKLVP